LPVDSLDNLDRPTNRAAWLASLKDERWSSVLIEERYSEDQPRDDHGRFGASGASDVTEEWSKGIASSLLNREGPSIEASQLGPLLERAAASGNTPPYVMADITNLKIHGTFLMGQHGLGIPRSEMPQVPGASRAQYFEDMAKLGFTTSSETITPLALQPSQSEVSLSRTGELYVKSDGVIGPRPLLISKDNFIIDGHHTWAAAAAIALGDPSQKVSVSRMSGNALDIIAATRTWSEANGIAYRPMGARERAIRGLDLEERYSENQPRVPAGSPDGGQFGDGSGGNSLYAGTSGRSTTGPIKNFFGEEWKPYMIGYDHLIPNGSGGWKFDARMQKYIDTRVSAKTAGVPSHAPGDRTAYYMGGGPGSGKSSAMNDPAMGIPGQGTAVVIEADVEKTLMPGYQAMLAAGDPGAAEAAHELSSYIGKMQIAAAMANGQNYVLDGTGDASSESINNKIGTARLADYKVVGTYVTVPISMAIDRVASRGATPGQDFGRTVPDAAVNNTHVTISNVLPSTMSNFDTFRLVDTTNSKVGDPANVIAETTFGQPLTVHDAVAYQAFLDKGNSPLLTRGQKFK